MSFWSQTPGPTWWDCIESLNPCIQSPYGLLQSTFANRKRYLTIPKGVRCIDLSYKHAADLEQFLKDHFSIYSRCRISLSKERIRQGFQEEHWLGVGIYTLDKQLIGCCISKPLGRMKFTHETLEQGGVVDYFCIHKQHRKQGFAGFLLNELLLLTAQQERLVHIFLKEGFPLWKLPPLYTSQYIARSKQTPGESKDYIGSQGIGLHSYIHTYNHADYLPLTKFVANLPYKLTGDSELSVFNYKGHVVFLCMTNLHHRTVPEGKTIGELSWIVPQTPEVPLEIQQLATEACIDSSPYDIVLLDKKLPHDTKKGWTNDATYSWYVFNYNPGDFFNVKPFWIF